MKEQHPQAQEKLKLDALSHLMELWASAPSLAFLCQEIFFTVTTSNSFCFLFTRTFLIFFSSHITLQNLFTPSTSFYKLQHYTEGYNISQPPLYTYLSLNSLFWSASYDHNYPPWYPKEH